MQKEAGDRAEGGRRTLDREDERHGTARTAARNVLALPWAQQLHVHRASIQLRRGDRA